MTLAAFIARSKREKENWKYTDLERLLAALPAHAAPKGPAAEKDVGDHPRLVVSAAPAEQSTITLDRFEWFGKPLVAVADRLDIVMGVEHDGRGSGRRWATAEDRGAATGADNTNIRKASTAQKLRDRGRGALHRGVVESRKRDARDARQPLKVGTNPRHLPGKGNTKTMFRRH